MRSKVYLIASLALITCSLRGQDMSWSLDSVTGEPLLSEAAYDAINEFERTITVSHDEVIGRIPDNIRQELLACTTAEGFMKLPLASQLWLGKNVGSIHDGDVAKAVLELDKHAKLHDDDINAISKQTFWCRLHGKPFELDKKVCYYLIYWKENTAPQVKFSPQGMGEISWIWTLDVKERLHGVMHVGIDKKRRTFICFERPLGLYFPEGEKLERIYREIVQEPDMALDHIGKGRPTSSQSNSSEPVSDKGSPAGGADKSNHGTSGLPQPQDGPAPAKSGTAPK
jgi:hypothetical protein